MLSESNLTTAKTVIQVVGTVATTAMVARSISKDLLPPQLEDYLFSGIRNFLGKFSNETTLVIDEFDGLANNELYEAAEVYLGSKENPKTRRFKISKPEKEKNFKVTVEKDEEIVDVFQGQKLKWVWVSTKTENSRSFHSHRGNYSSFNYEVRSFCLTFHRKNKEMVMDYYLPYVASEATKKKLEKRTIKLLTVDYDNIYNRSEIWQAVTFNHPSTFETLAMDVGEKDAILRDLERFLGRRDYYRRVGKAWKRGYLLYGPPGTGKSSLIAAIANNLNFDVYDLELTELRRNSDLRKVLLATENRSILVIEDIDCSIDLDSKLASRKGSSDLNGEDDDKNKVTLSGLLNFVDGLWSSCGDERIIIFTTNHVEKLDPALLRPGRMDVHVHMSYCVFSGFKTLAHNYLGIEDHPMFGEIEDLFRTVRATPAEIAEELLKNDDDVDVSLRGLVDFMRKRMTEDNEEKNKKEDDDDDDKQITTLQLPADIKENGRVED